MTISYSSFSWAQYNDDDFANNINSLWKVKEMKWKMIKLVKVVKKLHLRDDEVKKSLNKVTYQVSTLIVNINRHEFASTISKFNSYGLISIN